MDVIGCSPGPIYMPASKNFGKGNSGKGSEFSMASRSFSAPWEEKKTREAERPGPKYMVPDSVGVQIESHKTSSGSGKFNASERKTMDEPPEASPGPAAYDTIRKPVGESRVKGMGTGQRFFDDFMRPYPGPGQYKMVSMVGGYVPDKPSQPVVAFSKAQLRNQKEYVRSPGPVYKIVPAVGKQVSSALRSPAMYGFGTSSRFPASGEDLREHNMKVHKIKGGRLSPGLRPRQLPPLGGDY